MVRGCDGGAREWCDAVEHPGVSVPELVTEEWRVLCDGVDTPVGHLIEGGDWRLCEALLTLHAVADEACAGLAVAVDTSDGQGCLYRARGREFLVRTGSLADFRGTSSAFSRSCGPSPPGPRRGRSPGMHAWWLQASKLAGTNCLPATRSPIRGESTRTCSCCRGHSGPRNRLPPGRRIGAGIDHRPVRLLRVRTGRAVGLRPRGSHDCRRPRGSEQRRRSHAPREPRSTRPTSTSSSVSSTITA